MFEWISMQRCRWDYARLTALVTVAAAVATRGGVNGGGAVVVVVLVPWCGGDGGTVALAAACIRYRRAFSASHQLQVGDKFASRDWQMLTAEVAERFPLSSDLIKDCNYHGDGESCRDSERYNALDAERGWVNERDEHPRSCAHPLPVISG